LKPDMTENRMRFDLDLTNRILGLNLSIEDARFSLEKSRLSLDSETAIIPAFRMDVMHSIDLAEDVALGYGIQKFSAEKTETSLSGSVHPMTKKSRQLVDLMVGFGLIEIYTPSLANKQLSSFFSNQDIVLRVDDSKSESYDFLKSEILPSLLSVLGSSTHEEYPQGIFEQSPVFKKSETSEAGVVEEEHLAAAIADSSANFSAIKSILEPLTQLMFGQSHSIRFEPGSIGGGILAEGRTALVSVSKANSEKTVLGLVGEVSPFALESFGLKVPVSAFEINLRPFLTN
jgi:phenylalanyl-tRNA synthetase beta chain